MIALPAGVRILLATRPVDFRRGAHALAGMRAPSAALWRGGLIG
jgi:transposase